MDYNFSKFTSILLPKWCMDIRYNSSIIPDGNKKDIIHTGANCQVYAYEILRFNNKNIPDYRSSELWEDTLYSSIVSSEYHPGDILFFNKNNDPYGAHLGIYLGDNKILHNSKDIGKPAISELNDFKKIEKYKCLIGAKRFRDI